MKPPIGVCADCATEQQASVGLNDLTRICAIKAQLKAEQNVETKAPYVLFRNLHILILCNFQSCTPKLNATIRELDNVKL